MPAYVDDTIAAIATAAGIGAIAIVRLSGSRALEIASAIARDPNQPDIPARLDRSHHVRLAQLRDPVTGLLIDQALTLPMRAPHSYTGEDVVELHCHGGPAVTQLVLRAALRAGARAARPGEFTERAFLNGKLDLCQAEAVADLITASSEGALALAQSQLAGRLSGEIEDLREALIDARALVEAHLDFPEDDLPEATVGQLLRAIEKLSTSIAGLAATYERTRLTREGARVVLVGKPNVGKSSLMNAILGRDRALVSDTPGTTRDFIEEPVGIGSLQVLLCDTAGLRTSESDVERAGVERTRSLLGSADLVVAVFDVSRELDELDRSVLREVRDAGRGALLVARNKADLEQRWATSEIRPIEKTSPTLGRVIDVSATLGSGIEELCVAMREVLAGSSQEISERPSVTAERHHEALLRASGHLDEAADLLRAAGALEMVALAIESASAELSSIIGIATGEDVLDRVFQRFCIGK